MMNLTEFLSKFEPRSIAVHGVDDHLKKVTLDRLTPQALRERFLQPPLWTVETCVEKNFTDRRPTLAAVLMPLVIHQQEVTLLLTQRTSHLSSHSGEIAFPGGRIDSTDANAIDTALREAYEEVGLIRDHVEILGTLPTYVTGTAYSITPVVALVKPGFTLWPNPDEVADVFEVPLAYLMNPAHHRWHQAQFDGVTRQWLSMPYLDSAGVGDLVPTERFIWGATAGMLRNLYRFLVA